MVPPCEGGFKEFSIDRLFEVPSCSKKISKKDAIYGGNIPIYSSDTTNNGIVGYCNLIPHWRVNVQIPRYLIFGDHTRSFNIAETDFCVADNVKVLVPKTVMCTEELLYIIALWRKSIPNLGYARHWSKAKDVKLTLPVNRNGEIDFHYMGSFVRSYKDCYIKEVNEYLNSAGFEDCTLTVDEEQALTANVPYKSFDIVKEFNVANSHNILKSDVVFGSGSTPYVTACEGNNSIVSHIFYNDEMKEEGNSIMIGGKTLVITYQPDDFFSNDSHNLVLKINNVNGRTEAAQLFMVATLYKSLSPKYSWGDSISKTKIQKDKVLFPIDSNGGIDYAFMETYIRAIMKQTIGKLKAAMTIESQEVTIEKDEPTILDFVEVLDRFNTYLPVYPLRAACGYFDECGKLQDEDAEGWIDASGLGRTLNNKMFVVYAEGDSMEPKIHDGELCVFDAAGAGSREGKIVLCKARDKSDRNASSFTIKKYHSEKIVTEEGWMHSQITLSPLNSNYNPIIISAEEAEEDEFRIYGEFICVI